MLKFITLTILTVLYIKGNAQDIITVQQGATLYLSPGASISLGRLGLEPAGNTSFQGPVKLAAANSVLHPVSNLTIKKAFRFTGTYPMFSGRVSIRYTEDELGQLDESLLNLYIYNGAQWVLQGTDIVRDAQSNLVTTTVVAPVQLDELTLATAGVALPLLWGNISFHCNGNSASLKWSTQQEIQTDYFQIEASTDGVTWSTIGSQPAAGQSGVSRFYQYVAGPGFSAKYLRIRSVDMDGRYDLSKVVTVAGCGSTEVFSVFPSPAISYTTVSVTSLVPYTTTISLYDSKGQLIQTKRVSIVAGTNRFDIDLGKMAGGSYFVSLHNSNGEIKTCTILKR